MTDAQRPQLLGTWWGLVVVLLTKFATLSWPATSELASGRAGPGRLGSVSSVPQPLGFTLFLAAVTTICNRRTRQSAHLAVCCGELCDFLVLVVYRVSALYPEILKRLFIKILYLSARIGTAVQVIGV